jgi:ATP-binding cassette subfamily G (WHITE) protein 2 (SNQ2)
MTAEHPESRPTQSNPQQSTHHNTTPHNLSEAELRQILSPDGNRAAHDSDATLTLRDGPFDFAKTLRHLVKRREESDVKSRELGVLFENLRVVGRGASATFQPTIGTIFNPLLKIKASRNTPLHNILSGFDGTVRPGEMLLVLGRPGSGCSTLLKVLANQRAEYHAVEGNVHYDALSPQDIATHHRGDVQYCPEDDVHFPTLTVDQTISFAAKTRAPKSRIGGQSRSDHVRFMTDVYTTVFGLTGVKNTPVGDATIRGVSGGEKKRVSISEALATRSLISSWDNSTRGLDASTALEFVRALRIATDLSRTSTIVSLYQAGEQLYEIFDKVCVIYDGKMAYFGPSNKAKQYFIDMGYQPANRQTTADFLVAVTDPNARIPRADMTFAPRTAAEFEAHYKRSTIWQINKADMDSFRRDFVGQPKRASAYLESVAAEHAKHTRTMSPYTISLPMQVRAVMLRRVQIMKGDWVSPVIKVVMYILNAIIIGTVFFKVPDSTSAYFSRGGVLFFSVFLPALFSMSEVPALFSQRPIVHRHQKAAMYHPMIEAIALTLVDVPITFLTIAVYTVILYFLAGLQRTPGQFFIFFLFIFTSTLSMKALFRALAAGFRSPAPAQSVAGVLLLSVSLYTGYNIPRPSMIGALRWISIINPLRYAFESLVTNEFHTLDGGCASLVPHGAGYEGVVLANQVCTVVGSQPGLSTVDGNRFVDLSFGYHQSDLWRNFGIVLAFGILFFCVLLVLTEFNTALASDTAVTLFKRKLEFSGAVSDDEEKALSGQTSPVTDEKSRERFENEVNQALANQPKKSHVFSWQHLTYVVPVGAHEHKKLLDDVSGFVAPGKLTALMGESGAGKTTLLNVLAERVSTGVVSGDRFVNGQALPRDFQAQTGYCQQMDTHLPTTTVREALLFSAKMRQPQSVPLAEKEAYVDECLKMCGLKDYGGAIVGSLGVENRKRVTIGVELAAKPQLLLFLDEPTSGLDSQSAWAIMVFLRNLADHGQAILCTIHQPSAELFQVFDRLLLLRKGGQTVYYGDLGHHSTTLINYFERNGSRPCKPDENPAEFMLDIIGAGATATTDRDWHQVWHESKEANGLQDDIEDIHTKGRSQPPVGSTLQSEFATSWGYQAKELLVRGYKSYWRTPPYIMAKLMLNIVGGLFIGFTFFKAKDSIQGTQNKLFAIFMSTIISAPLGGQIHVPYFMFRQIYEIRERSSRMYRSSALTAAQLLVELPWNMLGSSLFFFCWYFTVGFKTSRTGYTYLMYGVLFPLYYTSFAQLAGSLARSIEIAGMIYSFVFSLTLIFSGIVQPYTHLGWWKWMYRVSPLTYLAEGLLGQAIARQEINCAAKEFVSLAPPSGSSCGAYLQTFINNFGGYLANPDATDACQFCSSRTTDEFMGSAFHVFYSHRWRNVGIFCSYILFNVAMLFVVTSLVGQVKRVGSRKA